MENFFRTPVGQVRGIRLGAYCYLFNTLVSLIGEGWRSISWMLWLLMAFGFFVMSQGVAEGHKSGRSKWHSLTYVVGTAASLLGAGSLLYRAIHHFAR